MGSVSFSKNIFRRILRGRVLDDPENPEVPHKCKPIPYVDALAGQCRVGSLWCGFLTQQVLLPPEYVGVEPHYLHTFIHIHKKGEGTRGRAGERAAVQGQVLRLY